MLSSISSSVYVKELLSKPWEYNFNFSQFCLMSDFLEVTKAF